MRTLVLFNNKGGVGKTTLAYHLSHMFARLGHRTLAVDLDPQANLTSAFFDEDRLEEIWEDGKESILASIQPRLSGTGDIAPAKVIEAADNLFVLPGDLGMSRFEDKLSQSWPGGFQNDENALRDTTSFYRIVQGAGAETGASIAVIDVGPNLGAINRAALLAGRASGADVDEVLVDITPHTLSVGALDRAIGSLDADEGDLATVPVIPRGTAVPVERSETVQTVVQGQKEAHLPIAQGEAARLGDCARLGTVLITDIPRSPAGSPVDVTFRLDLSGVLHVTAVHRPSGRATEVTIADGPARLTHRRRARARKALAEPRRAPEPEAPPRGAGPGETERLLARALCERAARALAAPEGVSADARERVARLTRDLERGLAEGVLDDLAAAARREALADALLDL